MTLKRRLARLVSRYILWWHVATVLMYLVLIALTFSLWPATDLTIQISVLVTGFFSGMGALATVLIQSESEDAP